MVVYWPHNRVYNRTSVGCLVPIIVFVLVTVGAIVAFANNISIGKLYAKRNKYEIAPNQVSLKFIVKLVKKQIKIKDKKR